MRCVWLWCMYSYYKDMNKCGYYYLQQVRLMLTFKDDVRKNTSAIEVLNTWNNSI
jgi:hypothetical protein